MPKKCSLFTRTSFSVTSKFPTCTAPTFGNLLATTNRNAPNSEIDQKKFLTEVEIGQNVLISVPNVDRGKRDPSSCNRKSTQRLQT
jgi:hypothetical protein